MMKARRDLQDLHLHCLSTPRTCVHNTKRQLITSTSRTARTDHRTRGEASMTQNPPDNMPRISAYLLYEDVAGALD